MKLWKEGDGAVEKLILIQIAEQDDGSGFAVLTCAASPCDSELWMEFWDVTTFPLAEQVPCAPGAIPNQTPSLGMEPLCQKGRDRNRKLYRSWFFTLSAHIQKLLEFCVNSCF